ncbi:MAG TPA: hypothetical protein VNO20_05650 [Solirubrobacterales bacterium]|nr:hypothetical protein [Solirubrobacterales bacterium]
MGAPVAGAAARALEGLSRLRGKRVFHPYGVGFNARLEPCGEPAFDAPMLNQETETIVRLSRALGLPEWAPDPCGLGLRIPDAYGQGRHQDILMVSSATAVLARHAPLPARGFSDRPYSTLLPYELKGQLIVIGARESTRSGRGPKLAELREHELDLEFDLGVATLRGGWKPVARLSLQGRLPRATTERLDLDPTNTGGGLRLAGWINRLRGPSYRGSQAGRAAARAKSHG